jgi:hypothetical protein
MPIVRPDADEHRDDTCRDTIAATQAGGSYLVKSERGLREVIEASVCRNYKPTLFLRVPRPL